MQIVSQSLAAHPPVVIGALCVFMYIRGKFLEKQIPEKLNSENL